MSKVFKEQVKERQNARAAVLGILVINIFLTLGKLICGFTTGTLSMVAEGFHSLLDASANAIAALGLTIALKPPDAEHPYGHRKFEALSAIAISFFMFLASFEVLSEVIHRLLSNEPHIPVVTPLSYGTMLVTLFVNFLLSRWEQRKGLELHNTLLLADSKHTFSDVWATLAVVATLVAIQLKFLILDIVCSTAIVVFILKAGFDVIISHMGPLVDEVVLDPKHIEELVLAVPGVSSCHKIRSRGMQDHVFIDLHVQVPRHLSIEEAHHISFAVEDKLKSAYSGVIDVLVHIEDDAPAYQS